MTGRLRAVGREGREALRRVPETEGVAVAVLLPRSKRIRPSFTVSTARAWKQRGEEADLRMWTPRCGPVEMARMGGVNCGGDIVSSVAECVCGDV